MIPILFLKLSMLVSAKRKSSVVPQCFIPRCCRDLWKQSYWLFDKTLLRLCLCIQMCLQRGPVLQLCSGFPVQLGPPISGAAKAVIRTGLCLCGCCPDEQHSGSGASWTAKADLCLVDAMYSERGRETYGQTNSLYCFIVYSALICVQP